jgi:hypothetical protein
MLRDVYHTDDLLEIVLPPKVRDVHAGDALGWNSQEEFTLKNTIGAVALARKLNHVHFGTVVC